MSFSAFNWRVRKIATEYIRRKVVYTHVHVRYTTNARGCIEIISRYLLNWIVMGSKEIETMSVGSVRILTKVRPSTEKKLKELAVAWFVNLFFSSLWRGFCRTFNHVGLAKLDMHWLALASVRVLRVWEFEDLLPLRMVNSSTATQESAAGRL